jgi:hypothetical protein
LLLLPAAALAEVKIDRKHWVANVTGPVSPGGYCVYCSLETLGRHRGDKRLHGLVAHYSRWPSLGANTADIIECLDGLGVKHDIYRGQSLATLKQYTDAGVPVAIGLPRHMVVAVDVKDGWIKTIDSNWIGGHTWHHGRSWDGWMLVLREQEAR